MVVGAVILAIVLVIVLAALLSFNRFVRQRQLVDNSWSNVDTELKRRYDLIPNLVATVKGYAAHERTTLEAVVKARSDAVDARGGAAEQATQENVLVDALKQLLALREAYPDLKASRGARERGDPYAVEVHRDVSLLGHLRVEPLDAERLVDLPEVLVHLPCSVLE